MAYTRNPTWKDWPDKSTPVTAAKLENIEQGITDTALQLDGLANPELAITYNTDGTVASVVENGVTTTYTYNTDGTVDTATCRGVTRTFSYDDYGNVTGAS